MQMNVLDVYVFHIFFLNIEHVLELGGLLHTFTCSPEISRGKATFLADCSSTELPKARGPSTKVRGRWGLAQLA